ncbi:pyroglutamyl-peptidase 1-like [Synchiropus picturatus]
MASRKKVVVTGFEPFGEHAVNSSWVAVQELERLGLGDSTDLHICEVPVEYRAVQSLIPALWQQHQPQLVIHVGVSGLATAITLEQCGRNEGYKRPDNCRFSPDSQCCVENGPHCLNSVLDMEAVCRRVKESHPGLPVTVSKDAGRYLCDYTYYSSLFLGHGRAAFIHVPPLGKHFSSLDLGTALQVVIREMLNLLDEPEQAEDIKFCCHKHQEVNADK